MHCHPWETHDDEGDVDDFEGDVDDDEGDVDDVEGDVGDDEGDVDDDEVGQKGKIFIKQFVSICLLQHELWTMTTDQEIWAVGYFLLFCSGKPSSFKTVFLHQVASIQLKAAQPNYMHNLTQCYPIQPKQQYQSVLRCLVSYHLLHLFQPLCSIGPKKRCV